MEPDTDGRAVDPLRRHHEQLQPEGGVPTPAALRLEEFQRWLHRARIRSCGQGIQARLPDNVWQCSFTGPTPNGEKDFVVRWTPEGSTRMTASPEVSAVEGLDGSHTAVQAGDTITVTTRPILLQLR
ncbi:hypothetical protein GCM10010193_54110 [Kitasatospora atroaurantiaca]|uniref:Uncharacterized protein n=1 Tax=Kitasatospora atroaurantiaca TaxID=285545 RepID=A0A561EQ39_9ACTN|nr:hypothetical protein [Kitasatospora atroaurantiaca]TWE17699.1 hypothetical protein FB465_2737 [Kitasatospora atroaurantiaca]